MIDKDSLWKTVKGELEIVANPSHIKTHIPGTSIKHIDEEAKIIEITSPSDFARLFIEERLYGHLKQIIGKLIGEEYRLMFSVTKKEPEISSYMDFGPLFKAEEIESSITNKIKEANLNERYTLDRFIVGNNNRLAYAVSVAISDDPGNVYNPFFLYSNVGLGKTHLIHAIGHEIIKKHSNKKVIYRTGEQFLNEVIDALRKGGGGSSRVQMNDFKKLYRNLDVLIIDDIHAIAGKEATQEEFFHTFNALYMQKKQIILTSDRAPHEIKTLEERLSSRFASGMIADMQPPDMETRLAILKERDLEMKLNSPQKVLNHIASVVDTNIRELEARLLQTITIAKSMSLDLESDEVLNQILGQIDKQKAVRITPNLILKEVSKYYGVTIKDIKGARRTKNLVLPRQISMYFLRDLIEMGFAAIGDLVGGRDHSTVIHGVDKISDQTKVDLNLVKEIDLIKSNIISESQ